MHSNKISHIGSWVSVLLGGLTGLIGIAACFFGVVLVTEVITNDTLTAIAVFAVYSHPTIALAAVLLPTLWFTGRYAEKRILRKDKLLSASFKYCLITNLIIWTVFTLAFLLSPLAFQLGFMIPLALFCVFMVLSTFSIGLFVCGIIKRRITKRKMHATGGSPV